MTAELNFPRRWVAVWLLAAAMLGGCAAKLAPAEPSLPQRIAAAATRADHEALAAYYQGEAAVARAKVVQHQEMIAAYWRQVAPGRGNINMQTHCKSLIQGYESMAADYDGLAAAHQQLAAQAAR